MILPIQNGGFPYSFLYVYQRVTSVSGNYKNWEDTLHHPTIVILCYPVICPFSDPFYCKGRLFQVDGGRSLLAPLATLGRILPPVTGAAWDDLGWLGMVRRYPTGAGSNLELIWIQLDDLTMSDLFFWNWPIDGGFKHLLFSISYMGCHPSHWLSYFSRWFFNHQPDIHHMSIIYIYIYIHYYDYQRYIQWLSANWRWFSSSLFRAAGAWCSSRAWAPDRPPRDEQKRPAFCMLLQNGVYIYINDVHHIYIYYIYYILDIIYFMLYDIYIYMYIDII